MTWVAVAVGGASVVGAGASVYSANKQAKAAKNAAGLTAEASAQARQDLQPFSQTGNFALPFLADLVSRDQNTDFQRTEGFEDIQNSAAAKGKLVSGGTLGELTKLNSGLNESNRVNRFNELFNVATLGANAASGQATNTLGTAARQGGFLTDAAAAQAGGIVGASNALTGGVNNFAFLNATRNNPNAGNNLQELDVNAIRNLRR